MASKAKFKLSEATKKRLQNEMNAKAKITLDYMEEKIKDSLGLIYARVIEDFYDDYTPEQYKRTYMTYQGGLENTTLGHHIDNPVPVTHVTSLSSSSGIGRQIYMPIGSRNYKNNVRPYRAPTDWVFQRTFELGIHGISYDDDFVTHPNFPTNWSPNKRIKKDRTPAIRWKNAIDDFKRRKTGPRMSGIPDTCSLKRIKDDALAYANRMMR